MRRLGLASLMVVLLFGCVAQQPMPDQGALEPPQGSSPAPPPVMARPPMANGAPKNGHAPGAPAADASANQVRMVVRDFLLPASAPDREYQFYSYLLFTKRSVENSSQREAAALAFMCQFQDVGKALDLKLTKSQLAVFYAPVLRNTPLAPLRDSRSATDLLNAYDYSHAEQLADRLRGRFSEEQLELSIVASPVALPLVTDAQLNQVQVLPLVGRPPAHVARVISQFRELVKRPLVYLDPPAAGGTRVPSLAGADDLRAPDRFREFLNSLGGLLATIAPEARADEAACR